NEQPDLDGERKLSNGYSSSLQCAKRFKITHERRPLGRRQRPDPLVRASQEVEQPFARAPAADAVQRRPDGGAVVEDLVARAAARMAVELSAGLRARTLEVAVLHRRGLDEDDRAHAGGERADRHRAAEREP